MFATIFLVLALVFTTVHVITRFAAKWLGWELHFGTEMEYTNFCTLFFIAAAVLRYFHW